MTLCYPSTTDWSCGLTADEVAALDPTVKARAEALAWSALFSLTGGNISICPKVVRPCSVGCQAGTWYTSPVTGISQSPWPSGGGSFQPHISDGVWLNSCGCRTAGECSCTTIQQVTLPGIVGGIQSVWVGGATLSPTAYRVDNGDKLVRTDGGEWPICQDMNAPADDPEAFTVTYFDGAVPDEAINFAAGLLAIEFYKACTGGACKLPTGVTRVARQGVTYEVSNGLFHNGFTGIQSVDMVIRLYNPFGHKTRPAILSPDVRPARTQTWSHR